MAKAKEKPVEGAAVDLGDAGVRLYKDRSGGQRGGGAAEGKTYASTVAENARKSVADSQPEPAA